MATKIKKLRSIKLTWGELSKMLKSQGNGKGIMLDEEIKEITLMKPKEILIRVEARAEQKED